MQNKSIFVSKSAGFSLGMWRSQHPHPGVTLVAEAKERQTRRPTYMFRFDSTPFRLSGFASHGKMWERKLSEREKTGSAENLKSHV